MLIELKNAIKKEKLFCTEDGVDIFEGDVYWKNNGWLNVKIFIAHNKMKVSDFNIDKKFSTKEAAEEYVLMNKPCLSINNVLNLLEFDYSKKLKHNLRKIKFNLTQFVKTKL